MSSTQAPLPAEFDAVRPWTTREAENWRAARPPRWANPLGSAVVFGLALLAAMAIATIGVAPRSTGPADWTGVAQTALALAQIYWFLRLPELSVLTAPLLGALVAYDGFTAEATARTAAHALVLLFLLYGWSAALVRLRHRRLQRLAAQAAAGPDTRPLPRPLPPLNRGIVQIPVGVVLCALAAAAFWYAGSGAAPFDMVEFSSWQLIGTAIAAPGVSLLGFAVPARRRTADLRRGPVPVLKVLIREDVEADTWVYAADDSEGRDPLFSCVVAQETDEDEDEEADEADEHGLGDVLDDLDHDAEPSSPEEAAARLRTLTRPREAVLFGLPCARAEVALVSATTGGELITEYTFQAVRPVRSSRRTPAAPLARDDETLDALLFGSVDTTQQLEAVAATIRTAARLSPREEPAHWGPRLADRAFGLLALFFVIAVLGSYLNDQDFPWWYALLVVFLGSVLTVAAGMLNWRATADRDGLWLTGAWRVRHLPWDRLGIARYENGELRVRERGEGVVWSLRVAPSRFWRRGESDDDPGRRAADEVTAMRVHPQLRPARISTRRERGWPVAPLIVLPLMAWTAWALYVM
ncbi:hypothetical protein [Streptomyces sp. NPDC047108]|uniref:hypothetical protein n=1 Tax=Streptomyces sp. NPDC047108 TaxID=3155025 RepID=UPI0033CC3D67